MTKNHKNLGYIQVEKQTYGVREVKLRLDDEIRDEKLIWKARQFPNTNNCKKSLKSQLDDNVKICVFCVDFLYYIMIMYT